MNRFNRKKEAMKNKKLDHQKMLEDIASQKRVLANLLERKPRLEFETETIVCQQQFDYWHQMNDSIRYGEYIKQQIIRSISEKLYDFADLRTEGNIVRCEILVAKKSK
jgi:hypothetical protein